MSGMIRKFSFSNRVRTLWNSLPDTVVKAESENSFSIDSGMIRKANIIRKLTLKAPEAEVTYNIKFLYSSLSLYRTSRQLACVLLNHVNLTCRRKNRISHKMAIQPKTDYTLG